MVTGIRSTRRLSPRATGILLLAPLLALYGFFFVGAVVRVVLTSLETSTGASVEVYKDILLSPGHQETILRTLRLGIVSVAVSLIIGFPTARYLVYSKSKWRPVVFFAVVAPILVSAIGRTFGWISLFGPGTWVAQMTDRPLGLLFTEVGVMIGVINVMLPFMVLGVVASLVSVDTSLFRAGQTLGARPIVVFRRIEFPLTVPGVVSGCVLVFSLAMTTFATPSLIGGVRLDVLAYAVYDASIRSFNVPLGSAIAMLLFILVGIGVMLTVALGARSGRWRTASPVGDLNEDLQ